MVEGGSALAVLAVIGLDADISPDWCGMPDQVTTRNDSAAQLRGTLVQMPPDTTAPQVNALTDAFEARFAPKPVWTSAKMGYGVMDRMMRMILPFRFTVTSVGGTGTLNQTKPAEARQSVIAALGAGHEMFRQMRKLDD